jgi:hypothetical protein
MVMKRFIVILLILTAANYAFSQTFEESVSDGEKPQTPKVSVGADFALQLQALQHHADSTLIPLGKGINLPTANLNIKALLADGIEVNLTTYLSSRHHNETWVKGGYLLIDKLPFIHSATVDKIMDYVTLKVGVMELNYGDAHFRRSDNGNVLKNSFVGNYIVDAFTTAPGLEVLYRDNGVLLMGGLTTGTLKPALVAYNAATKAYTPYNAVDELAFYWKAGYDKQFTDDLRVRATLSGYHTSNNHFGSLYNGDRTGSRYYLVMNLEKNSPDDVDPSKNHTTGSWGPGFTDRDNSLMANLFTRYRFIEFFGTWELAKGTSAYGGAKFTFTQYAAETIMHFGKEEQFFGGARYNYAKNDAGLSINRVQVGAGWNIIPTIVAKLEYVNQEYSNFKIYGGNAGFNGIMFESAISF